MMNSNKIGKREINEELINVWAMMISKKIDDINEKLTYTEDENEFRILITRRNAYADVWALLSSLEAGRFKKDYDRIVKEMGEQEITLQ